jgi:hypothetical protein
MQRVAYFLMLLLTACYLVVELAFNARLLDVVGGQATPAEISAIEKWGRLISGIALTLAVWGSVILPLAMRSYAARVLLLPMCALAASICIGITWAEERRLIDKIVSLSDGELRRTALQLRIISFAALNGNLPIGDIDLGGRESRLPSAKAFLAIFPDFVLLYPKVHSMLTALVSDPRMPDAIGDASDLLSAREVWNTIYQPYLDKLRTIYNQKYLGGSRRFREALDAVPALEAQKWKLYVDQLSQKDLTPEQARPFRASVVAALRQRGLELPDDWDPADQQTFFDAVAARVRSEATENFATASTKLLGSPVPPELSWQKFCEQPAIMSKFQTLTATSKPISCDMTFADFETKVYPGYVRSNGSLVLVQALRPPEEFNDEGPLAAIGRRAMEGIVVPPIALGFSLLGACVHVFKAMRFAVLSIAPDAQLLLIIPISILIALIYFPVGRPNAITTTDSYRRFESVKNDEKPFGKIQAVVFRWVIEMEAYAYPINDYVRTRYLGGLKFDEFAAQASRL